MYNLHCHTLLSDGELLPSETAVRYLSVGYKCIAITDHADYSNIESCIRAILKFCRHWPKKFPLNVLPGIELTHLPLDQFKPLASFARKQGIKIIIAHGETIVEPVIKGTNLAALEADIDILAHPGLITDKETKLAKKRGIFLEVTSRRGHCNSNRHLAKKALKFGANLILNNDSHGADDIISPAELIKTAIMAGLTQKQINIFNRNVETFLIK
ncbi:MAG: histidinol phosphate phosphatase domain-containing protein [Candidatus Omnitrophica bacterium]|nr:histidinol phosphate phosphatase domain-containing protein [Candidatus Omnitrophota bacterium]